MTTFDLHILRRLTTGFFFLLMVLIVFFIVLHYVEYIDDFMDRGASMREVFLVYYPNLVPEIVRLTTPLALFLACVYLTGKLSQEFQLLALQTAGVSLYRLIVPYLMVGSAATVFLFGFGGWIVPVSNQIVIEYEQRYLKDSPRQIDVTDIHRQNRPGSVLSVGYYDRNANTGHRVTLLRYEAERRLVHRIDAGRMTWVDSLGLWRMQDVTERAFTHEQEILVQRIELDTLLQVFPRDLARSERDIESMTIPDARSYLESLRRSGVREVARPEVSYYSMFSYPVAAIIVVLLGVPLSAVRRRRGQAMQLTIGLFVAFVYLALLKIAEPLGYAGAVSTVLASWLPHMAFALLAVVLLATTRR